MPKLTIGMAHYDDFHGAYFSIQALRLNEPDVMKDVEFVVVDNSPPNSKHSQMLRPFVEGWARQGTAGAKYVPFQGTIGTSAPRDQIFKVATGDAVLAMDCHVLYPPGTIKRLIEWYDDHPDTEDIYSGPLVYDDLHNFTTHFDNVWRGEMWGIWARAWKCCDGGVHFSARQNNQECEYFDLTLGKTPVQSCHKCNKPLPTGISWAGHENKLREAGYRPLGEHVDDEPFEIPGMGLGVFSCRRKAWLGFHEHASGFGGEELYIHEKFRQEGRKAMCLPFLRWVHRFARPDGVPYPLPRYSKVRNYVLEFQELGFSLDEIHDHFVKPGLLSQQQWDHLVEDPIGHSSPPPANSCGNAESNEITKTKTVKDAFKRMLQRERDLNRHMPKLRELAEKVEHVTEFGKRTEGFTAFAAAQPKKIVSYNVDASREMAHLTELARTEGIEVTHEKSASPDVSEIEATDLLFIDSTAHNAKRLNEELKKFSGSVARYIVMHDTALHGNKGDDGGAGLFGALLPFLKQNQSWQVVYHTQDQYGLTVISKDPADRKSLPSTITMAKNFAKASLAHIKDGAKAASQELLEARLAVCTLCEQRNGNRCSVCGCGLSAKAGWLEQNCPLDKWPTYDKETKRPHVDFEVVKEDSSEAVLNS
ncbi:Glycosyl transferase family 2 [Bremerella volcania]|uniref:Glycosyl transferase family 2 n=1 Tax=Bremerella volcania TaxID=2527984 RepID=A0A518C3C3_9BACT|nr:glycosyltransferase [Bremerella volcania]QDU73726.1 Glycosyl transferase family 2 [Bremerella volcania]